MRKSNWFDNHTLVLDVFVIGNLAFLAVDVFLAHLPNGFAHWGKWVPVLFSIVATLSLLVTLFVGSARRWTGLIVGRLSIVIGVGGLLFHLDSQFFADSTIKNLVYTAPFVAPLAFCGLGMLLLINHKVHGESLEWGMWVTLVALGGFVGNFVLSLCDHAQNGFFDRREWIPVFTSGTAVGFLMTALLGPSNRLFLKLCVAILVVNGLAGGLGFYLHLSVMLESAESSIANKLIYGVPLLAPLLFIDLALLGILGIWHLARRFH